MTWLAVRGEERVGLGKRTSHSSTESTKTVTATEMQVNLEY